MDAVVLCSALSRVKIAGLSARERAVRVARRVGATRVVAIALPGEPVDDAITRDELVAWRAGQTSPVLVIRADQLVHTPLVAPLIAQLPGADDRGLPPGGSAAEGRRGLIDGVAIAVGADAGYAGALIATGRGAAEVIAQLARGDSDTAIAGAATARVAHGEIARHAIATADDRRAAHRMLYRILIKPQDNAITRYLYRPVSLPLTRLLVWTPITPNQVSYVVAALVVIGCWLTAHAGMAEVIAGSAVVLAASYVDCCDGEIARVKLLSSRLGAWIDTIVDELSSIGYMAALGWHCHLAFGRELFRPVGGSDLGFDPWNLAIAIGLCTYGWSVYCIYFNIIVGVGSANSQDYAGRFEVVPGRAPGRVRLRPVTQAIAPSRELPGWLAAIAHYLPYVIRRDFISWCSLVLAVAHRTPLSFGLLWLGGLVTAVIVTIDHVRLRRLLRSIARGGQVLEQPA
jgi:hypothetical protein